LGTWLIFGRTEIILDKPSGQFTKTYRLRSFRLFQKGCNLEEVTTVSVHRNSLLGRLRCPYALYFERDGKKPVKLLDVPRKSEAKGLEIARKMAEFLGVPGSAESKPD
jgi:hypothetical protein